MVIINKIQVLDYLTRTFNEWHDKYSNNTVSILNQDIIGRIALFTVLLLLKIKLVKKYNHLPKIEHDLLYNGILGMDGNADNWHEIDNLYKDRIFQLDDEDQWLVEAATQLLRYGG